MAAPKEVRFETARSPLNPLSFKGLWRDDSDEDKDEEAPAPAAAAPTSFVARKRSSLLSAAQKARKLLTRRKTAGDAPDADEATPLQRRARGTLTRAKSLYVGGVARSDAIFPPLRRARSFEMAVEDDTTSHPHEVRAASAPLSVDSASEDRSNVRSAGYALASIVALSCGFYTLGMGWAFHDALYFTVVTLTTVGYGDLAPTSRPERVFAIVLFFLGAGVVGAVTAAAFEVLLHSAKLDAADAAHAEKHDLRRLRTTTRTRLRRALLVVVAWSVGGAFVFRALEDDAVDFLDAFYWSGVTLTTVGYGDVVPTTTRGKIFATFYALGGTLVCVRALGAIAAVPLEAHRIEMEAAVLTQYGDELTHVEFLDLTRGDLVKKLNVEDDGKCSKATFAVAMLVKLGKIDEDDVAECVAAFNRLDRTQSGYLGREDVAELDGRPALERSRTFESDEDEPPPQARTLHHTASRLRGDTLLTPSSKGASR